jgi:hypothetical protein
LNQPQSTHEVKRVQPATHGVGGDDSADTSSFGGFASLDWAKLNIFLKQHDIRISA